MADLGDEVKMFQNEGKKMRNWSTSTTTILNMFSSKNSLKEDLKRRAAKRFDTHNTRQVQFEASLIGNFERIQNLPCAKVACLQHGNLSP